MYLHYEEKPVNLFRELSAVYCVNHTKNISTFPEKNTDIGEC
jgi:hypothetical protein